jgi:hypothetical protein
MRTTRILFIAVCTLIGAQAVAQNNRSFVATYGNDANNCTAGNECRSFTRALSVTNPGGEVIAVNSGGYGPFTISQAITVVAAPGAYAAITSAADGVDVAAGSTDRVVLKGLKITLTGASSNGIYATAYGSLYVEDCSINGGLDGLWLYPSTFAAANVTDTVTRGVSNVGFALGGGKILLLRCRAENGDTGVYVQNGSVDVAVTAVDVVTTGNAFIGIRGFNNTSGHNVDLNVDHAVASNNGYAGIAAESGFANVNVRVSNSVATNNTQWGFLQGGPAYFGSMINNLVAGNGTSDTAGTISMIPVH